MKQGTPIDPMITSADSNEYYNAVSHLIGAILSVSALATLVTLAALRGHWAQVVGFSIYGTSLLLLFLASCLLHFFLLFGRYKRVFGILDHCAIYLLIAGTYTPFCLSIFEPATGWLLFGIIWSLTVFFITIKAVFFVRLPLIFSNASYIVMGWIVVFFLGPILNALGPGALVLMAIGGLCYTIGALIFARGWPNPFPPFFGTHEIWHTAVMLGAFAFFLVMLWYVLPYSG